MTPERRSHIHPAASATKTGAQKYLYNSSLPQDWSSVVSECDDDDVNNLNDDEELAQCMLETGRLTDREADGMASLPTG